MLDSHNIYYGTNEWVSQAGRSSGFPTRDGAFDAASQTLSQRTSPSPVASAIALAAAFEESAAR